MSYVLIFDGVIVQKQPNDQAGFVEAPDWVVCGMRKVGDEYIAPSPALTVQDFHKALYDHFDAVAMQDRWDNRITYIQRASLPGYWQAPALAYFNWINECEVLALGLLAQVEAGTANPPANTQDFISMLPPPPAKELP